MVAGDAEIEKPVQVAGFFVPDIQTQRVRGKNS